jgi:ABC-type molybdate transport system ATPase subunit
MEFFSKSSTILPQFSATVHLENQQRGIGFLYEPLQLYKCYTRDQAIRMQKIYSTNHRGDALLGYLNAKGLKFQDDNQMPLSFHPR